MRESTRTEKMHLPKDSGEEWLESQRPKPSGTRHRNPPQGVYETWLEKRVERRRSRGADS